MRKLSSFTFLSLDGYYKGIDEDITWHRHGEEENQYSEDSLESNNILLFGRTTYEVMYSFWPTPMAAKLFPKVALGMNKAAKIVFSNSFQSVYWNNTQIMNGNIIDTIRRLKSTEGDNLSILGSGSMVRQFSESALIDSYQIMIDPVVLGKGTSLFNGMKNKLDLELVDTRVFKSGVILLIYQKRG